MVDLTTPVHQAFEQEYGVWCKLGFEVSISEKMTASFNFDFFQKQIHHRQYSKTF